MLHCMSIISIINLSVTSSIYQLKYLIAATWIDTQNNMSFKSFDEVTFCIGLKTVSIIKNYSL